MLKVYPVTVAVGRPVSFGLVRECASWKEANRERAAIARAAKDPSETSLTYDINGNFVVDGWQKGF